jgi:hypothetical protein
MQSLDRMLAAQPYVIPRPGFAERVVARLEARRIRLLRLRAVLRVSIAALCLWSLAVTAVVVIGGVTWPSVMRPTLFEAAWHILRGIMTFVSVLGGALRSVLGTIHIKPLLAMLLGYLSLAGLMTVLWLHVVLRRSVPASLRP